MTQIKEQAIDIINQMPDNQVFYVVNILQSINNLHNEANATSSEALEAFENIKRLRKRIEPPLDDKEELARARMEKYESLN